MTILYANGTQCQEEYNFGVKSSTKPLHDSKIDVLYFPTHGRASPIVMMLGHQKVDFTVSTVQFSEWGALKQDKARVPCGFLPVVDIDGKKFSDTMPMLRMLGMKLGIYDSKDPIFTYHCDMIMDKFADFMDVGGKAVLKKDEAAKKQFCTMLEKLLTTICEQMEK